jgi:hypothetical protein
MPEARALCRATYTNSRALSDRAWRQSRRATAKPVALERFRAARYAFIAGDVGQRAPARFSIPPRPRLPQQLNLRGSGSVATTRARYHRVVGPNFKFRPAFTTSTSVLILIGNAATSKGRTVDAMCP